MISMTENEKLDWLRLARTDNIGPITFYRLLQRYHSAAKALEALPHLTARNAKKKPLIPPPKAAIEKEYERLTKLGGHLLCALDPAYPLSLSAIEDAPPVISVLGNLDLLGRPTVGVVGARNASLNARKFAEKISADLGKAGFCVASGLARGIDTAAHHGALKSGTIAVVAGGVDVLYPPENKNLYDALAKDGLIVAESPLGQEPFAQSFPRRNRIISGLSQGVVVVEASLRSGSLITARMAAEQGRDVFAVPGHPMDPRAEGTNSLIRDGAILTRCADDIINDLGKYAGRGLSDIAPTPFIGEAALDLDLPANDDTSDLSSDLLTHLSATPIDIDDLIRLSGARAGHVGGTLLSLELSGEIQRLPGNRVVKLYT
jgi:DNA processing protein